MPSWDDVRQIALALPEAVERPTRGRPAWWVAGRMFVWDRPLHESDRRALGAATPEGPILGARVEHLIAKEALLADPGGVYFTTPHFDNSAIILVRLDRIGLEELREVIVEAWLARAPTALAEAYQQS